MIPRFAAAPRRPHARRAAGLVLALAGTLFAAPALAHGRGCTETSRVVGHQRCTRYAMSWDTAPGWRFGFALFGGVHTLGQPAASLTGALGIGTASQSFALSRDQFAPGTSVLVTAGARAAVFPWRWIYLAAEVEYGAGPSTFTDRWTADGSLAVNARRFEYISAGGAGGVALPLGDMTLGLECLLGAHSAMLLADVAYGENVRRVAVGQWSARVEPRLRASFFVHRNVTVGVTAGVSVLPQVEFAGSVFVEVHTRAYDGLYDR